MFGKLFGDKKPAPKPKSLDQMSAEEVKAFQDGIRKETRNATREVERQIFAAERVLAEAKRELEKKVKEGTDRNALRIYAQNVMRAQASKDKQLVLKTRLQGVEFSANQLVIGAKMSKTMGDAGVLLGRVNALADVPGLSANVEQMQAQLAKIGIVGEMVDDALDEVGNEDVDIDDKAQALLDALEAKHNPKLKKTQKNQQADDLDEQIKNLAL